MTHFYYCQAHWLFNATSQHRSWEEVLRLWGQLLKEDPVKIVFRGLIVTGLFTLLNLAPLKQGNFAAALIMLACLMLEANNPKSVLKVIAHTLVCSRDTNMR